MKLIELSSVEKESYNRFIAEAPSGSFLQSWEWGQWQEKLGKKPYRFFLEDDAGINIAALQIIISPLPLGRYYLYAPYGPVVKENFQFSIFNFQFLLQELKKRFSDAVFVRIEPKANFAYLNQIGKKTANIQPGKTLVVNLQQSQDDLLAGMHPKTRYNIKLAQRHGVEVLGDLIAVPGHGLYVKEALDLIVETADRQSFQAFGRDYYQRLLDFFALQNSGSDIKIFVYKALLGRELLASALLVDFGQARTYLFGGSAPHHREVMAPHLLHFTAMMDAKKAGLKLYDFWGIETSAGDMPGFARFKTGFGGKIEQYPGAYDVRVKKWWFHGYKTLRQANRTWLFIKTLLKSHFK